MDVDCQAAHKLLEEEAAIRSSFIQKVSYQVSLELRKDGTYSGSNTIKFSYLSAKRPADFTPFLDFTGKSIHAFTINSQKPSRTLEVAAKGESKSIGVWNNNRLYLDPQLLKDGENVVQVNYTNNYDKTGAGPSPLSLCSLRLVLPLCRAVT